MFLDENRPVRKHRDRLPHWHQDRTAVFLTWRLADSLPESIIEAIQRDRENWLQRHPRPWTDAQAREYNRKFILPLETKLDEGHGQCILRYPQFRQIVCDALHFFDDERYGLDAYVIMPNHVHLLLVLSDTCSIKQVVQSLKSFTAKAINRKSGGAGKLWQRGYWDRLIRSEEHLEWTREYIVSNPKKLRPGDFTLWSVGLRPNGGDGER